MASSPNVNYDSFQIIEIREIFPPQTLFIEGRNERIILQSQKLK